MKAYKYINPSDRNRPGSIANLHFKSKGFTIPSLMSESITKALDNISEGYYIDVTVSRRRAMLYTDQGKIDHDGKWSIFGQVYRENLEKNKEFTNFRIKGIDTKCWKMTFKGEGADDWGGPFRDTLVNIVKELETGVMPLFIKTPNNRNEIGNHRDCYILNPAVNSPTQLDLFKFLGCIIAFSIISTSPTPLNLAPTFWKQLAGDQLTLEDLVDIDANSYQIIHDLQEHSQKDSLDVFNEYARQLNFTTTLSNGVEVELCENGAEKCLTKENLQEFIDLVVKTRIEES